MNRELLGLLGIVLVVLVGISHWRAAPDKGDYREAKTAFPRLHFYKDRNEVDGSLDVVDHDGRTAGRLVIDDGHVFMPKDQSLTAIYTPDLYLIDREWDIGTFGGYRDAGVSSVDRLAVGFRVSPVRLLYGTTAPDLVLAKDWAGAGLSFYIPPEIVGRTASHIGIGAWYGVPFADAHNAGDAAWCYGLTFSTR